MDTEHTMNNSAVKKSPSTNSPSTQVYRACQWQQWLPNSQQIWFHLARTWSLRASETVLIAPVLLSMLKTLHTKCWLVLLILLPRPFYGSLDFVRDNPGKPVPEETFTHSHLPWSSIIPYLLPPSFTLHCILHVQFTCLTVFYHNLSPSFLWSTSLDWHSPLHPIIVFFSQHKPIPSQPVLL